MSDRSDFAVTTGLLYDSPENESGDNDSDHSQSGNEKFNSIHIVKGLRGLVALDFRSGVPPTIIFSKEGIFTGHWVVEELVRVSYVKSAIHHVEDDVRAHSPTFDLGLFIGL